MNTRTTTFVLAFIFIALAAPEIRANESTGMRFLMVGPSAHNMGVMEANTASLTGASAIYINPAMLALEEQSSATMSYFIWPVTDTHNSFTGVNFRRENDAFAFGLLSSFVDDIPARQGPTPDPDGMFSLRYFSLAASYSRAIGPLSLGVTGMYLHEQFFRYNASGYGINAGIGLNLLEERVTVGSSLRNLGTMSDLAETSTKLPTTFSVGTDVRLIQFSTSALDDEIPFLISFLADYNIPVNEIEGSDDISAQDEGYLNAGLELNISELIDLRAGYRTGDTQRSFSMGAGLTVNEFYFNYAFMPYDTGFGTAHAISLQYQF